VLKCVVFGSGLSWCLCFKSSGFKSSGGSGVSRVSGFVCVGLRCVVSICVFRVLGQKIR
jgi:hypothetical protein